MIENKINEWFEKYHIGEDTDTMLELYYSLIDEEVEELQQALYEGNAVESYDALGDIFWVLQGGLYFTQLAITQGIYDDSENYVINLHKNIGRYINWQSFIKVVMGEYFNPVMDEIIKSNFSKDFLLKNKSGKITKGKKYVKPNISKALKLG